MGRIAPVQIIPCPILNIIEMTTPLVSVIMAVYNGEKFVREAVESILGQTFRDFEFIIIEDGSTDSTAALLSEYKRRDPRVRVKSLDHNHGLTQCLNIGMHMARGRYIARMDADDISLPSRFQQQVDFLEVHPEVTVLGTASLLITESGDPIRKHVFSHVPEILRWNLLLYNPISHPSVMMRTHTLKGLDGYDTGLKRAQDYDLWWRVSLVGRLGNLKEVHVLLRQHQHRITNVYEEQQLDSAKNILGKYLRIVLDHEIPADVITAITERPANIHLMTSACRVIWEYATFCMKDVSSGIKWLIVGQAVRKIIKIVRNFAVYRVAGRP